MREFCKINPSVWSSKRFASLDGDGQRFYLYCLTSPHSNALGCYKLKIGYIMVDLGIDEKKFYTVSHTVSKTGLIQYDREQEVIWIDRWFDFNPPNNPKHCLKIINELLQVPDCCLKAKTAQQFHDFIQSTSWDKSNVLKFLNPILEGLKGYGIDRVSGLGDTKTKTKTKTEEKDLSNDKSKKKKIELEKPDDVTKQTWADFTTQRNAKKAPITATVLSRIRDEAANAGWTLERALQEICLRGWQGFKAEWLTKNEGKSNGRTEKYTADDALREVIDEIGADRTPDPPAFCDPGHLRQIGGGSENPDAGDDGGSQGFHGR